MYEVNRVYIFQNQVGMFAYLNGQETTVIGPPRKLPNPLCGHGGLHQETDTPPPHWLRGVTETNVFAGPGDLRPKDAPPGEQSVLDLFKLPELEPA